MADKVECEIWLSMDEDGNWAVAKSADDVISDLSSEGGVCAKTVKLTVRMAPPELAEVEINIPDDVGTTEPLEVEAA